MVDIRVIEASVMVTVEPLTASILQLATEGHNLVDKEAAVVSMTPATTDLEGKAGLEPLVDQTSSTISLTLLAQLT